MKVKVYLDIAVFSLLKLQIMVRRSSWHAMQKNFYNFV